LLGPALGGYFVLKYGFAPVYFANALSYLPLILAVLSVPRRPKGTAEQEELRRGSMSAGIAYVRADSPTRAMVLLVASSTLFISPFIVILMPIYAQKTLALDPSYGGRLMAMTGIGSLIGALGVLAIPKGHRATALKCGAVAVVCGMIGMSMARSFTGAVSALIPMLVGLSTCFSVANIVTQERAPDELRGRISAVFSLSFFGLIPFSGLLVSTLVDVFGMRVMMCCGAIGYGLAALLLLFGRHALSSAPLTSAESITGTPRAATEAATQA
jgi:MFS family permease